MFINSTLNYFRDNIFLYINGKISKNQVLIHLGIDSIGKYRYRITAVLKVETDIISSITVSPT
jgi:hypothetical protein